MKNGDDPDDLFSWEHTHSHGSDPETSSEAASKAKRVAKRQKRIVFDYLVANKKKTHDQLRNEVIDPLTGQLLTKDNAAKRCSDLKNEGSVRHNGWGLSDKGNRAKLWEPTPQGFKRYYGIEMVEDGEDEWGVELK